MKIADTDIRKFHAKQLTVDFLPPPTVVGVEMYKGAFLPSENDTDTPLSPVSIGIYFRGETRDEIFENISNLTALLQHGTPLTLDGYRRKFMAYLKGSSVEKTTSKKRYKATFDFDGYWFSNEVTLQFDKVCEFSFDAIGNRPTPCVISIVALAYTEELKITGFSDEIIIENINKGENVVIDGEQGTVMLDGKNKFDDVTLWEFPYLKVGEEKRHDIVVSSDKMMVTIKYKPMWM